MIKIIIYGKSDLGCIANVIKRIGFRGQDTSVILKVIQGVDRKVLISYPKH